MRSWLPLLACAALLAGPGASRAEEPPPPLRLTIHPSRTEPGETLDEKLARRLRESDYLFRHICRGCNRVDAVAVSPFDPLETLRRAQAGLPAPPPGRLMPAPAAPQD